MFQWNLERPLVFFDIEATGINVRTDRIVELAMVKLMPPEGKTRVSWTGRFNPEMPIPAEASAVHGIYDDDVANEPTFDDQAREILEFLGDADLGGYNCLRYDIPLLTEEFLRAQIKFNWFERRVVDAQRIFHVMEPRDLSAAVRYFCGRELEGAHGAEADTQATIDVIEAQLERYGALPKDHEPKPPPKEIQALSDWCSTRDPSWIDQAGRLKWDKGEAVFNFSKKKGMTLKQVVEDDPNFVRWIIRSDFPMDTRDICKAALDGRFPVPPS